MSFVSNITNTNYDVTKYKNSIVLTPFKPTPASGIDGIKEAITHSESDNIFAEDAVAVSEGMTSEL